MEAGEGQHYIIAYPGMYNPMDAYIPPMMPTAYWILGIQGGKDKVPASSSKLPHLFLPLRQSVLRDYV